MMQWARPVGCSQILVCLLMLVVVLRISSLDWIQSSWLRMSKKLSKGYLRAVL